MAYSASGPYCDVSGAPRVGVGYSFSLALLKLDEFYSGFFSPSYEARFPSVAASACGGTVTMECVWGTPMVWWYTHDVHQGMTWGVANPQMYDDLTPEQQAAVSAWFGQVPDTYDWACCYLFAATARTGEEPGGGSVVYKAFGWCAVPGTDPDEGGITWPIYQWIGDNEWVLAGSLTYDNLQCKLNTTDHWSQKFAFRHWSHRSANYGLFTSADETTSVATIGGASSSHVATYEDGASPAFNPSITQPWTPAANTDYAQVQGVSSNLGSVELDLTMSLWSQPYDAISSAPNWKGSVARPDTPEGQWPYVWHFFCDGATFCMQAVELAYWGPDHGHIYGTATATVFGPVRFDVQAGRGGYQDNENFPLPSGFQVDVGIRHWISETETEIVWLGPGTSRYYTFCLVGIWYNVPATAIKTGSYHFGSVTPAIREEWLRDNKEYLTHQGYDEDGHPYGGEISNRNCWIALPSLEVSPDSTSPYWGPALRYRHNAVSLDMPPGYEERPTAWTAGARATVDPEDNAKWTATQAGAVITRALASRFDARMNYLAVGWDVGKPAYDRDWPVIAKANHQLDADPPEVAAACEVEDVTNYDNTRIVRFSFKDEQYPENVDWSQASLKITYAAYDFRDEWYIQPAYNGWNRFGANGVFEYDTWDGDFTFKGFGEKVPEGQPPSRHLFFDLAELQRSNVVNLRHVRSVELVLPTAGTYVLDSFMAIPDPDKHGARAYPHLMPQQGTNPWNWQICAMGWGSTVEGMPHLNIPNGTEGPFKGDVQWGIKGLQYWQYNPLWLADQEEPPEPFDPTTAWNLQRLVAVLGLQEQLTATVLDAGQVGKATADEHGNSLGFLYFWDLNRPDSDCGDERAAISVGTLEAFGITCPLIPLCANVRWSTHGRGQGMAYQGGTFVRMEGGSSEDGDEYAAQVWKRPLDDEGGPVLDENGDPMPWQVCGSFSPDVTGRFVTPPLPERGWEYKTNTWGPGRYVTREYQYITALFVLGWPVLAISTNHVANTELVSDVRVSLDGRPGHVKLQRGNDGLVWSKRFPMSQGEAYRWGNIIACMDRTEFVVDDDTDTFFRQAKSLDGGYLKPFKVAGYVRPFGLEAQNRLLLTAVQGGNCYFLTLAKEPPHAMIGAPVLIGPATEKAASSLAYCVPHGLLFAAVQTAGGEDDDESEAPSVTIYSSTSRGAKWQATGQTAALAFPYLYGDDATLWMVGYDPTPTGGAQGTAKILKFFAAPILAAPQVSADVGPADRGRPAIIRRAVGGELIVAAGKVTTWAQEGASPAIVEYRSIDGGQTFNQRLLHALL